MDKPSPITPTTTALLSRNLWVHFDIRRIIGQLRVVIRNSNLIRNYQDFQASDLALIFNLGVASLLHH